MILLVGGDSLPRIACYDDGCHLVRFVQKNVGKLITNTPASEALKMTKFYIDKSHWKNHVGTWCKENMSPYSNSDLNMINTQCAEQHFSWLKRYSAIISSLGWMRAPLYLLVLFHYKNLSTCNVRPTTHFNIAHLVPDAPTISLPHAASIQQESYLSSSTAGNDLIADSSCLMKNAQSNTIDNNKWMTMSKDIQHDIKQKSSKLISTVEDSTDCKWTKITDKINSSRTNTFKERNKRGRTKSVTNQCDLQVEQIFQQVKKNAKHFKQ
ncbi:unnamed protein product [Rotaria socialis]|uniref:Uncharacterized protein n=1 Tax=Rotaria socialis TaxID=392032 RepID=A0A820TBD6_9BILA|nr:unnamed protein product [Rotaria socialis]CAF4468425.1 unnamed protein product [Rotaria socialis]